MVGLGVVAFGWGVGVTLSVAMGVADCFGAGDGVDAGADGGLRRDRDWRASFISCSEKTSSGPYLESDLFFSGVSPCCVSV